jgi:riboflavin synthase alpha subunit
MFTGIVEHAGRVASVEPAGEKVVLRVDLGPAGGDCRAGDSISVAGVCLTLTGDPRDGVGSFEAVRETLSLTTLGALRPGSRVNLERALRVGDRLGGHFVQGHVDGVGTVRANGGPEGAWVLVIAAPREVLRFLIGKGSVGVDGVSLTVATLDGEGFTVALVPHTLERTTLGSLRAGDRVNLEADLLGKWIRRLAEEAGAVLPASGLTREALEEEGFGDGDAGGGTPGGAR